MALYDEAKNKAVAPAVAPAPVVAAPKPAAAPNPMAPGYDALAKGSQVKAVTQTFDESKGVEGRVDSIIGKDSPLMQRAATRATQMANARGLRNSSMAVGAGQGAVIDAAMPIATADAQLYQQQALTNQGALNDTNQFNSKLKTEVGLTGLEAKENSRQFDAATKLDYAKITSTEKMAKLDADTRTTLAKLDVASRKELAGIEAAFKKEIAANENIANAWGSMTGAINDIQNNPDLEDGAKRTAIQNQINSFQSFAKFWQKVGGGTTNVKDLLNFGQTGAPAPAPKPAPAPGAAPVAAPPPGIGGRPGNWTYATPDG